MENNNLPTYLLSEKNNNGWTAELSDGDDEIYFDTITIPYANLPVDAGQLDLVQPTVAGEITKDTQFVIVKKCQN